MSLHTVNIHKLYYKWQGQTPIVVFHLGVLLDNDWSCTHDPSIMHTNYTIDTDSLNFWQSTDRPPTVDRHSADNQWSTYQPSVGRYIDQHISRASVDIIISQHTRRYVGRHIGQASVNMLTNISTDISIEGYTNYTWSAHSSIKTAIGGNLV